MSEPKSPLPWRVGRKVGRTLYDANEKLIGVMDNHEDAAFVADGTRWVAESFQLTAAESYNQGWDEAVEACARAAASFEPQCESCPHGVESAILSLKRGQP